MITSTGAKKCLVFQFLLLGTISMSANDIISNMIQICFLIEENFRKQALSKNLNAAHSRGESQIQSFIPSSNENNIIYLLS